MQKSWHLDSQQATGLESIGGEPLAGSGFENEAPEPAFSDTPEGGED
jgi:hypothetical protein